MAFTTSIVAGLHKSIDALVFKARSVGLEIGHSKCATILLKGDGKRKRCLIDAKHKFLVKDVLLRAPPPEETYKYFGLEIGPSGPGEAIRALAALIKDLGLVQKAPFKLQQKLWTMKYEIGPKHLSVLGKSGVGILKRYDLEV